MKESYSANNVLKNFGKNLGFRVYIFDDPQIGPQIKLIDKSKKAEIDAILLYGNIICLVGINNGKNKNIYKQIDKFFEKLDEIDNSSKLDLDLSISASDTDQIKDKIESARKLLKTIKKYLEKTSEGYDLILKKIFFCPNKQVERVERKQNEFIIDKDVFEYFQEVYNRLSKRILFNDFMYFLHIKKVDLQESGVSRVREPATSNPYKVNRLELEKEKIITYSFPVKVKEIEDYVTVLRIAQKYNKEGFQRMIKLTRLNKINKEYLSKHETFPNNIIIGLSPEVYTQEVDFYNNKKETIRLFNEYNSLILIDGQHRFFSFVKGGKENRYILATLVFFKVENKEEAYSLMYNMFYKINKTQERIDPNLSFILVAKIDPNSDENFWYSVFKRLDKKGFFANRFSFKEATLRKGESRKSIISVITYGGVLKLNKTYKRKGIKVEGLETFYEKNKERNISFAFNLLKNYFDIIEAVLHSQNMKKDVLTPREIGALIRIIRHFMIKDKDKLRALGSKKEISKSTNEEDKEILKYFKDIFDCVPFGEVVALGYPASNWAAIEGYILKKIHKFKLDFGDKNLLSKKGLEVYEDTSWDEIKYQRNSNLV